MSGAITAVAVGAGAAALNVGATTAIMAGLGAGMLGATISQGQAQQKQASAALRQQESAQAQATAAANKQASDVQQAQNKANQKRPDVAGIMSAASQDARSGPSATMLTGPMGVNPADMKLGKNTLLGG